MGVESVPNRTRHLADILFYGGSHPSLSYFQNVPWDACYPGEQARRLEVADFACLGLQELWVTVFAMSSKQKWFRSSYSRFAKDHMIPLTLPQAW